MCDELIAKLETIKQDLKTVDNHVETLLDSLHVQINELSDYVNRGECSRLYKIMFATLQEVIMVVTFNFH